MGAHRGQLIEASKELVQRHDQLLGCALRGQAGETLDISKQYAAREEGGGGGNEEGEKHRKTTKRSNKRDIQ